MNDLATRPSSPRKSAVSSGIDHITKAARVVSFDVADNSLPIETASKDHKEEALNRTGSDNSGVLHHRTDTQFADQNPSLDDTGSIGEQVRVVIIRPLLFILNSTGVREETNFASP